MMPVQSVLNTWWLVTVSLRPVVPSTFKFMATINAAIKDRMLRGFFVASSLAAVVDWLFTNLRHMSCMPLTLWLMHFSEKSSTV